MALLVEDTGYFVFADANNSIRHFVVRTLDTVDAADTIALDLTKYGINTTGLLGVLGFKHTTDNSVMVQEQPTTAVSGDILTLTIPAGTDNDPRYYIIWGFATPNP